MSLRGQISEIHREIVERLQLAAIFNSDRQFNDLFWRLRRLTDQINERME